MLCFLYVLWCVLFSELKRGTWKEDLGDDGGVDDNLKGERYCFHVSAFLTLCNSVGIKAVYSVGATKTEFVNV